MLSRSIKRVEIAGRLLLLLPLAWRSAVHRRTRPFAGVASDYKILPRLVSRVGRRRRNTTERADAGTAWRPQHATTAGYSIPIRDSNRIESKLFARIGMLYCWPLLLRLVERAAGMTSNETE